MSEEEFNIVGKQDPHAGGVVSIENLLQVKHVIDSEGTGHVERGFELPEIFAFESDSIVVSSVDFGLAFVRTVSEFLRRVAHFAAATSSEGTGLVFGHSHRHICLLRYT